MIIGIIPARYASSRFPGKSLARLGNKSIVQRVFDQASNVPELARVIVATDHEEIYDHVNSFGGNVEMTSVDHKNGTERCFEVASRNDCTHVVNIQGDEPFIDPKQISILCQLLDENAQIGTLIKKIKNPSDLTNPGVVKAIKRRNNTAIYFSRQPIPFLRDSKPDEWVTSHDFFKHIGLYGYSKEVLQEIVKLSPCELEVAESLEQLRWIENGYEIKVAETTIETIGVDTPEDLEEAKKYLND